MTRPIRLLLVDDHPLFTEGLQELLAFHHDLDVVGVADSAEEALTQIGQLAPDVILMDLQMPGLDGIAATRRIAAHHPATAVLALTMYDDDASVFAVLRAGARGYVLKGAHQAELIAAIRAVFRGEAVFGAQVTDWVLAHFATPRAEQPRSPSSPTASAKSSPRSRPGRQPVPSPHTSPSHPRPCATTYQTCSPNCPSPTEPRRSCALARPDSSNRRRVCRQSGWQSPGRLPPLVHVPGPVTVTQRLATLAKQ